MRRILVENARRKQGPRRGGGRLRLDLPDGGASTQISPEDLPALDDAPSGLAAAAPQKAELVKLRFFAGMTIPEAAAALGISHATAERHWTYARVWLYSELHGEEATP